MAMDVFRSVVSLGTKFLRIFVPSPPMDISPFFIPSIVEPLGVRTWCEGMRGVCLSQDNVKNFTIDKIVWAKEDDIVGHEYLVFRVRISVPSHTVLLKLERTTESETIKEIIDDHDPTGTLFGENEDNTIDEASKRLAAPEVKRLLAAKLMTLQEKEGKLRSSSSSCDSFRKATTVAHDRVHHIADDYVSTHKNIPLFTYRFEQPDARPLTLRDLAIIAHTIHRSCEGYDWKTRNCYWFARTMKDVIMNIAKPSERPHKDQDRAGRAGYNFVFLKWSLQKSIQNKEGDIEALVDQINRSIEEDDKRIRDISGKDERHAREMEALRREKEESEAKMRCEKEESEAKMRREKEEFEAMMRRKEESEAELRREKEDLLRRLAKYEAGPSTIPMAQSVAA